MVKKKQYSKIIKKYFSKEPFPSKSQPMWLLGASPSSDWQSNLAGPQIQPDHSLICTGTLGDSNRAQESEMSHQFSPTWNTILEHTISCSSSRFPGQRCPLLLCPCPE